MLKRKIEKYLSDWLINTKNALLIKGARQVGKTYSIEKFIDNNFKHVIKIDFTQRADLIDSFAQIKEEIDKYTKDNNIDNVTADIDELGLVININNSDIIFPPGQAQLTPAAKKILDHHKVT